MHRISFLPDAGTRPYKKEAMPLIMLGKLFRSVVPSDPQSIEASTPAPPVAPAEPYSGVRSTAPCTGSRNPIDLVASILILLSLPLPADSSLGYFSSATLYVHAVRHRITHLLRQ